MKQKHTETLRFERKREKSDPKTADRTAESVLLLGVIAVSVYFFGSMWGGPLTGEADPILNGNAIPVMSTFGEETASADGEELRELLRKNLRDTSAEPFGYMNGRWNLWEYLGDVMAELLIGG